MQYDHTEEIEEEVEVVIYMWGSRKRVSYTICAVEVAHGSTRRCMWP